MEGMENSVYPSFYCIKFIYICKEEIRSPSSMHIQAALIISSISGVLLHRMLQIFVLETLSPDKMPKIPRSPPRLLHKRKKKQRGHKHDLKSH